ncbi:hypothetical protein PQX77_002112 [Marasmius sp. AFHP31]|nr:hypothetical protein PQX77_002112 [Marasmius sp. AFHP31]
MPNDPLRWRSRQQTRRLVRALGAGSGVAAVVGAVFGSHAALGCGVTSGVLSIGAALLLQERSCVGDVESGAGRGSEENEEHNELESVTQTTSSLRSSSQPSQKHANSDISEPEVHETLPDCDGVDLVHDTNETQSIDISTVNLGITGGPIQPLEDTSAQESTWLTFQDEREGRSTQIFTDGLRQRPTHSTSTPSGNQTDQHDDRPSTISLSPQAAAPSPSIKENTISHWARPGFLKKWYGLVSETVAHVDDLEYSIVA